MQSSLDHLGGNISCTSTRESIMYQAGVSKQDVPLALCTLAATVTEPLFTPQEINDLSYSIPYEQAQQQNKPENLLPELLHKVVFKNNTFGNPMLCTEQDIPNITAGKLHSYRKALYTPERILVAAVGCEHNEILALAKQHLAAFTEAPVSRSKNTPVGDTIIKGNQPWLIKKMATVSEYIFSKDVLPVFPNITEPFYTGGNLNVEDTSQDLLYMQVGFPGLGISSEDVFIIATLQMLLGGGGSFSTGGPGKGMYSRIYTRVLNRYWWMEQCNAVHHCYSDTGLFVLNAAIRPDYARQLPSVLCEELFSICEKDGVRELELDRARNQLKSSLLMNLESRLIELEDLGRQMQVLNYRITADEVCKKVDAVSMEDIRRIVMQLVSSPISVVSYGKTSKLSNVMRSFKSLGLGK